jgi:hypothetical protein
MSDTTEPNHDWSQDLRSRVKQLTQPLVDSLDSRMREQVDHRVDYRLWNAQSPTWTAPCASSNSDPSPSEVRRGQVASLGVRGPGARPSAVSARRVRKSPR